MSVVGRWRILEMELWAREDLDLVAPAYIDFGTDGMGRFGFTRSRGGWIAGQQLL